jgi:hypothetical protein
MRTRRMSLGVLATLGLLVGSMVVGALSSSQRVAAQEQHAQAAASWPSEQIVGALETGRHVHGFNADGCDGGAGRAR